MITHKIVCEACGSEADAEGAKQRGWGTLAELGKAPRDLCPRCIAKAFGWRGVSGTVAPLGRRVRDVEIHKAVV